MLKITERQKQEMVRHARDSAPDEACGILAGKDGEVDKIYKMKNTSETPELCYFMHPREQLSVMKEIRRAGLEMLAIYHSHTASEAFPSAKDVELAYYPEALYIIISLKDVKAPEVRAFKIAEGGIKEVVLCLED